MPVTIPSTTLVCVDCANHGAAARAMRLSLAQCSFDDAILFTDREVDVGSGRIVRIPTITSKERYSEVLFSELLDHVSTDFVLVIQWDGYVIDGRAWRDEFQQVDYIGAVWPWHEPGLSVGNGGFSLRSRKLLEALRDPRFPPAHPEDEVMCRVYRPILEQEFGIRFADPDLAGRFAFERSAPIGPVFGFHGLFNLFRVISQTELAAMLDLVSDYVARSPEMMELLLGYFRRDEALGTETVLDRITRCTPLPQIDETLARLVDSKATRRGLLRALGLIGADAPAPAHFR